MSSYPFLVDMIGFCATTRFFPIFAPLIKEACYISMCHIVYFSPIYLLPYFKLYKKTFIISIFSGFNSSIRDTIITKMYGLFLTFLFCMRGLYNVREMHVPSHTADIRHPICRQEPCQDQKC